MIEPATSLDPRFSDPVAQAVDWATTLAAIESAELFWISTVRADGRPHVTPLVAVWLDDALHFSTGSTEQKSINLVTNAQVVLTTGSNEWDRGIDVMIEGRAERILDPDRLARLAAAWRTKWDGRWEFTVTHEGFGHADGGGAHVFSVRPTKVLAFGKDPFSHTSHSFPPPTDR